ncbi:hypothetical protein [Rhizobium mesosinicum]|nr:hypothetical protein [Rhizobium mesosinicum]
MKRPADRLGFVSISRFKAEAGLDGKTADAKSDKELGIGDNSL